MAAGDINEIASTVVEAGNNKSFELLMLDSLLIFFKVRLLTSVITRPYVVNNSPYNTHSAP